MTSQTSQTTPSLHPWQLSYSHFDAYSAGMYRSQARNWLAKARSYMGTPQWPVAKQCIAYARKDIAEYQRCMARAIVGQS